MDSQQLLELPAYFGLYFDPQTGRSYRADGADTGFTFERAQWTGPFGLHFSWPWLNPFSFATHETALRILDFAVKVLPSKFDVKLNEDQSVVGPFTRTVERQIVVSYNGSEETFSAGMLANSIIRAGEEVAARQFQAEVRLAGIIE